jgi:hypothetical protein
MALDPQQLQTLKAAINAETDATFVAFRAANDENGMAGWLNQPSTFVVWRNSVTRAQAQASGFDWTQVDNLSTGQARIWFDGLFLGGALDATDAGQRAGIVEAWKGTAAKLAVQTFVLNQCKRFASRGERVFATGTGTDATPGLSPTLTITPQIISDALRS